MNSRACISPRVLTLLALALLVLAGCQTTTQQPDTRAASADSMPDNTPTYTAGPYLELVRKYAQEGGEKVDYAAWKANPDDLRVLDDQVRMIAQISPNTHPEQFPDRARVRSYWINTYNTLVLDAVLDYWPLESVRDVKLSLTSRVVPGKGFFYDRKVVVGGQETNLYKLEKQVLRSQKDPRLHFALNCASESCPVLRPWEWTDEQLDAAAHEFINRPENVAVEDGTLYLSAIFKWYRKDFPPDIQGYLAQYAETELRDRLLAADAQDRPIEFRDYDWSLNADARETGNDGD